LYGRSYAYAGNSTESLDSSVVGFAENDDDMDMPVPIDPFAQSNNVKPFVPATPLAENSQRPFGRVLDAPLG
jgi:hypothetical protein